MYKKIYGTENGIQRISDGAFIPVDETNSGYQEYLVWAAQGNSLQMFDGFSWYYVPFQIDLPYLPTGAPLQSKTLPGRDFFATTIEDAVDSKLFAIRQDRDVLLVHSDLVTKDAYSNGNDGLRVGIKNNAWVQQLRNIPTGAETALQTIVQDSGTITDIFQYVPDFAPQALVAADIILTLRQFILALTLADPAFITNEEALAFSSDKTIPASIQAVFDNLPAEYRLPAMLTFKTMQSVSRNDPLVAAAGQSWGLTVAQLDQFFLTAFEL